jgi:hypothetical protein
VSGQGAENKASTPLDPAALDPGTSVLLAGPAMTGKRRLLFDLVGGSPDDGAIFVSTKRDADRFRREFLETRADPEGWETRVVDCVSKSRSVRGTRDSATTKYVSSAGDLTGIGIATSGFMREFHHESREARFGLHSLSTLLMYADLKRVFQFCHVMAGRMETADISGVFSLDTTARGAESLDVLKGLFGALVEVRDAEEGPECRVRGGEFGPRQWTPF